MIAYKLRRTHLIERKKENAPSTIVRNLEEVLFERILARMHLRVNDVDSGLLRIQNATQ